MLSWSPEYSVKIKEIDEQHNVIVSVVSELSGMVEKRASRDLIGTIIWKLLSFAHYHFATEEKYFALFDYEDAKAHIEVHNVMLRRLEQFRSDYFDADKDVTAELVNFTMVWLTDHILKHDKKYVKCFQEHGLR
jgi:hemerythrin